MGFLGNSVSAIIKTGITPLALIDDLVNAASDQKANTTKSLIENISNDLAKSINDLSEGKLI